MLYNTDGQRQITIVNGSSRTGLYAVDGTYNGVTNDGISAIKGAYHPCGALNVTIVSDPYSPSTAKNGSMNIALNSSGGYSPTPMSGNAAITTGITASNTSTFQSTYRAGSRNTRVAFIGDSTTRGQSFGVSTAQAVNSYPMQLSTLLNAVSINAGANNVWGDGGSWGLGQTIANFETGDSRVSHTLAWGLGSVLSAGGNSFAATAAGGMNFTPQTNCDTADIIWRDGATGRDFTWAVDGGATTLVQSTNVTQFAITTIPLGSLGAHTINLAWSAGNVNILGINAYNSSRKELTLWNWGICGGTSANLINNTDAVVGRLAILAHPTLKPDLAFIEGGIINDWRTSVPVATSKANVTTLVTTAKANGSNVILCTPCFDNGVAGLTASQQDYVTAMYQVASEQSVGIIDIRKKWISYANAVTNGWNNGSDTVHPTTAGYLDIATVTRNVIQSIV